MTNNGPDQITGLLAEWSSGNREALDHLMPLVYDELKRIARRFMRRQPAGHAFQTTELIHEAYLKIARREEQSFQNRAHFFGVAARAMRHILVDYARSEQSKKRGGWQERVTLDERVMGISQSADNMLLLDNALTALAELDERKCRVVELRYFGGLTVEEAAEVLNISPETVKRDWRFARTWLLRELSSQR